MKVTLIFISICTFFSCSNTSKSNEEGMHFKLEESYHFPTGFNDFNGKLLNLNQDGFMSFVNFQTHKKIVLHPLNNPEKSTEIELSEINKKGESLMDYEIINKDTILALTWYTNKLLFLNANGEIWREKTIGPLKMNKHGYDLKFELTTLFNPLLFNDSTIICGIEPYMDTKEFDNLPYAEFNAKLNEINAPRIVKIENIYSDDLKLTFGLDDYYKRFMKNGDDRREMLSYNFINDKLICFSRYSDSLYVYDQHLQLEKIIQIESATTEKIGMATIPLKDVEGNLNLVNEMYLSESIISGIHFMDSHACYLVNITHKKNDQNRSGWSSIALDLDFKTLGETVFSEKDSLIDITMKVHDDLIYIYKTVQNDFIHNHYNIYSLNFPND